MTISVSSTKPVRAAYGYTFTDAAGLPRIHPGLFVKQEDAEAHANVAIGAGPPGKMQNVEFFTVAY